MDNTKKLLSLCTGYGGIERGLDLAGVQFRTVTHVEIEAFAIANLVSKMEAEQLDPCPIWTDLKTLPLAPFRGSIDILTGGYPCQPFSHAGRRLGKDDPRHLWPWICRIIDGIMPRMCFFENVEGHITQGLRQVLSDLEARGYKTAWGLFSAEEVGAPHQRKRVFILADSNSEYRSAQTERWDDGRQARPTGETMANTNGKGRDGGRLTSGSVAPQPRTSLSGKYNWPARTGEVRKNWENPRTIEPKLGGTINGCPDRVDRLRLLGNGVVPQTAAKAFTTLIKEVTRDE